MPSQIINQATLTYQYGGVTGTAASNIAATVLQGPLTAAKSSLSMEYRHGEEITYSLTLSNNGAAALTDVQIVDDMGAYTIAGPVTVTPLTYTGPASLYVNGTLIGPIVPDEAAGQLTFTIASLAAGANAMILYKATVNDYALRDTGATLTTDSTFTAAGIAEPVYSSHTLNTEDYAQLSIVKTMSPNPVTDGGVLTYDFVIYNYGNMDAANVVLTDTFNPAPTGIGVTLNGEAVLPAEYDYTGGVLTLPGAGATMSVTVPAAVFTQDAATGLVSVSPGMANVQVTGTV